MHTNLNYQISFFFYMIQLIHLLNYELMQLEFLVLDICKYYFMNRVFLRIIVKRKYRFKLSTCLFNNVVTICSGENILISYQVNQKHDVK